MDVECNLTAAFGILFKKCLALRIVVAEYRPAKCKVLLQNTN